MDIFVEWIFLWNGYFCGMDIFVEWASLPVQPIDATQPPTQIPV